MNKKSIAGLIGVALGVILLFMGFATTSPERIVPSFVSRFSDEAQTGEGTPEYVGGDAYNFLIEASIRGGEIAGARTARAVYLSVGALTITVGAVAFGSELDKKEGEVTESLKNPASEQIGSE